MQQQESQDEDSEEQSTAASGGGGVVEVFSGVSIRVRNYPAHAHMFC